MAKYERHGMKGTRIYGIWETMKKRCNNQNCKDYNNYGGRGITYDAKWENFSGFYEDMGSTYSEGLTLERIEVNSNYTKSNCEWIPRSKQSRNRRFSIKIMYNDEEVFLSDLYKKSESPASYTLVANRVRDGWDIDRALSTPPNPNHKGRKSASTNN